MTNINLLKSKMAAAGYTTFTQDLMILLGVSWTTASQKLNSKANFSQKDINILIDKLGLTGDEVKEIFMNGDESHGCERSSEVIG